MSHRLHRAILARPLFPLLGLVAIVALAGLVGCAGSATQSSGAPEPSESPALYSRVIVNSPGRANHDRQVGYVGDAERRYEDGEQSIIRVYDESFRCLGFYLSSGGTYRLDAAMNEDFLGNHEPAGALERLLGIEGPFRIVRGL